VFFEMVDDELADLGALGFRGHDLSFVSMTRQDCKPKLRDLPTNQRLLSFDTFMSSDRTELAGYRIFIERSVRWT
jgi:hypothetical protein